MANDYNNCTFTGRLGRDPETRYLPNGDPVTNFSLAVGWKAKDKEGTEWVRVNTFGKLAEICGEHLRKGSQALVSGRMQTREWEDKEGIKRQTTEIVAERVQFLGGKQESAPQQEPPQSRQARNTARTQPASNFSDMDDDIPF